MVGKAEALVVGKIYRLRFPGIAARVIEPPPGAGTLNYPYLVESLFVRSRWYVNEFGEPDNISSPLMVTPARRAAPMVRDGSVNSDSTGSSIIAVE